MRKSPPRTRLLRLGMFWWVPFVAVGYGIYVMFGVPHFIFSYRFHDNGNQFDPFGKRHYTECSYVWIYPAHGVTVPAKNGRCAWFRFAKLKDTDRR